MFLEHGMMKKRSFLSERIPVVIEMIRSFGTAGVELTMTAFNKQGKLPDNPENKAK